MVLLFLRTLLDRAKMAETVNLILEPRTVLGKKVRQLRKAGIIPVHLYGKNISPQSLQCDGKILLKVLTQAGMNTPVTVAIVGQKSEQIAFVREIQFDPRRGDMVHVDFLHVDLSEEISTSVPIVTTGVSPGARALNGSVVQILFALEVRALPLDIPGQIEADLAALETLDDVIRVKDLPLPSNVTNLVDEDNAVARIEVVRSVEIETSVDGAGETIDGGGDDKIEGAPQEG